MTDSKLRELERRWKETQSVEDEAAYLLERVRVGDLEREKLELAAYCGHEAAQHALGGQLTVPRDPEDWVVGLARWGKEPVVFVAVAAGEAVLHIWEAESPQDLRPRQALETVVRWLRDPSETNRKMASAAADALGYGEGWTLTSPDQAVVAARDAASAVADVEPVGAASWAYQSLAIAIDLLSGKSVMETVARRVCQFYGPFEESL